MIAHKRDQPESHEEEPTAKRQKIEVGQYSIAKVYSPSQTPLRIDNEKMVREELRQKDVQGGVLITTNELEENMPQEAPK